MSKGLRAMLIDPQGNVSEFKTSSDGLKVDDLRSERLWGPWFDLGSITEIEIVYSVRHSAPAIDGLISMLGGAAVGGAAGAAVMAYFFSKDRGQVVCYTNVKLAGHGDTVFKFIADEPIVDKVFLIIEEKNYFGQRTPNLTCGFLRWLDNFLDLSLGLHEDHLDLRHAHCHSGDVRLFLRQMRSVWDRGVRSIVLVQIPHQSLHAPESLPAARFNFLHGGLRFRYFAPGKTCDGQVVSRDRTANQLAKCLRRRHAVGGAKLGKGFALPTVQSKGQGCLHHAFSFENPL